MNIEKTVVRQDSNSEIALAELFLLTRIENRMADEDAIDEERRPFQFKASTKSGISTAREFGPATIKKLRNAYLIVAYGDNYRDRFEINETYFFSRCHIDPWLIEKELYFNTQLHENCNILEACRAAGFDEECLSKIERKLHRGMLLNDPNIPRRYIKENGILITENHPEMLRKLVSQYPLEGGHVLAASNNIDFITSQGL